MADTMTYVGLDVHKDSIDVALADAVYGSPVRSYGAIDSGISDLDMLIRRLQSRGKKRLDFVYEAGPCGYEIYRHLTAGGFGCTVVAPSKVPRRSSDRIKTDRRDAVTLAGLHRAGELTPVYVPEVGDEAMRDLTRAREDAKDAERKARQRLGAFLLRHGFRYAGKTHWTRPHFRWIADISMAHPAQQIVLQEYVDSVRCCTERVSRLTAQIREFVPQWRMAPVVGAIQALRGVSLIVATTTIAELGDLSRFEHPSELMAFLGLVASEHSSGAHRRQGGITKTGNRHARRALVEAAWAYRFPARVSRQLRERQAHLPPGVCETAWKAQLRLCTRFRRLAARGKVKQVVTTAIARELCGFIWAIARQVPVN